MIINLGKLINAKGNKYVLTRSINLAIDRIGNIKGYPEGTRGWKIVPHVISMVFDDKIKYYVPQPDEVVAVKEEEKKEEE